MSWNGSASINRRSAKVPESPSSALQTTYSMGRPRRKRSAIHRRRECRAAAPAQAGGSYLVDDLRCRQRSRARQPLESAVGAVGVEVERIDHAGACKRQPRLALQERQIVDAADTRRWRRSACRTQTVPQRASVHPRKADTSLYGLDLDQRFQCIRAARAIAHHARVDVTGGQIVSVGSATASAPNEQALVSFGTKTRTVMVALRKARQKLVETSGVTRPKIGSSMRRSARTHNCRSNMPPRASRADR